MLNHSSTINNLTYNQILLRSVSIKTKLTTCCLLHEAGIMYIEFTHVKYSALVGPGYPGFPVSWFSCDLTEMSKNGISTARDVIGKGAEEAVREESAAANTCYES